MDIEDFLLLLLSVETIQQKIFGYSFSMFIGSSAGLLDEREGQ